MVRPSDHPPILCQRHFGNFLLISSVATYVRRRLSRQSDTTTLTRPGPPLLGLLIACLRDPRLWHAEIKLEPLLGEPKRHATTAFDHRLVTPANFVLEPVLVPTPQIRGQRRKRVDHGPHFGLVSCHRRHPKHR